VERAALAQLIDHTLLKPEATAEDVQALCDEAVHLAVKAVCVSPSRLPLPPGVPGPDIEVTAVVGFPSGAHRPITKASEAAQAVEDGATEIDLVIDLALAATGDWAGVEDEIRTVRNTVLAPVVLKVIIESALLDPGDIVAACLAAEAAGADFVKTSTGFHPAGGATVEAVAVMAQTVDGHLGVKASGGIRTAEAALAMVDAGATRLGCSATAAILDGVAP
jgi:deoxyribose-phosphate aldolase